MHAYTLSRAFCLPSGPSSIKAISSHFKTKPTKRPLQLRVASNAAVSGTTLKLLPLCSGVPVGPINVGDKLSFHFRKTLFISFGIPSITTVDTGTNGRSSIPAARIPYSWEKISALWNAAYCDCALNPTMI